MDASHPFIKWWQVFIHGHERRFRMLEYTLDAREIRMLMIDSMEIGVKKTLVELGLITPYLSQAQAFKMYGRAKVTRWMKEGLIGKVKDGTNSSSLRLSRMELETVAKTSNRHSWFNHYVKEKG